MEIPSDLSQSIYRRGCVVPVTMQSLEDAIREAQLVSGLPCIEHDVRLEINQGSISRFSVRDATFVFDTHAHQADIGYQALTCVLYEYLPSDFDVCRTIQGWYRGILVRTLIETGVGELYGFTKHDPLLDYHTLSLDQIQSLSCGKKIPALLRAYDYAAFIQAPRNHLIDALFHTFGPNDTSKNLTPSQLGCVAFLGYSNATRLVDRCVGLRTIIPGVFDDLSAEPQKSPLSIYQRHVVSRLFDG